MTTSRTRFRAAVVVLLLLMVIIGLHAATGFGLNSLSLDEPVLLVATIARWLAICLSYYLAALTVGLAVLGDRVVETPLAPKAVVALLSLLLGTATAVAPIIITDADDTHGKDQPLPNVALILEELDEPLVLSEVRPQLFDVTSVEWWVVEPGDSFWSIAEEHLEDELERNDLTDQEVADYWRSLIGANIDRLLDPENPDLIVPGQEFVLPRVQS